MLNSNKTKKVTIRMSKKMKSELQKGLVNGGYGLHGKSKWVSQAVEIFLTLPNYAELVENGDHLNQADLSQIEAFYLRPESINELKQAILDIRKKMPLMEGVQSAIIRASVVHKLLVD